MEFDWNFWYKNVKMVIIVCWYVCILYWVVVINWYLNFNDKRIFNLKWILMINKFKKKKKYVVRGGGYGFVGWIILRVGIKVVLSNIIVNFGERRERDGLEIFCI